MIRQRVTTRVPIHLPFACNSVAKTFFLDAKVGHFTKFGRLAIDEEGPWSPPDAQVGSFTKFDRLAIDRLGL